MTARAILLVRAQAHELFLLVRAQAHELFLAIVRKRTAFSYRVTQRRRGQQLSVMTNDECRTTRPCAQAHNMPVALHNGDDDKASCASARHAGCIARWQRQQQQRRRRQRSQRVPPYLMRKRTRLSAIVRKRTSYSVKHRHNNQLETSNIDDKCHEDNESTRTTLCASAPVFSAIVRKRASFQPSCASARATASAMGLHKLFCIPRASKKARGKV